MNYSKLVADDYMQKNDYNCAETMLHAANEAYDIGLPEEAMRAASAFGGGMGREDACGAMTGALMALGILRGTGRSHQDPRLGELRDEFVRRFEERFGSIECRCLKAAHKDPVRGCAPITEGAAEILEEVLGGE
ncbi:MAG: C-GCAxxG-C-C family (seleno)protein [Spirochaetota bacterium]